MLLVTHMRLNLESVPLQRRAVFRTSYKSSPIPKQFKKKRGGKQGLPTKGDGRVLGGLRESG